MGSSNPAFTLAAADALGDVDRLAIRVGVPASFSGAGREVNAGSLHAGRL